ncbi:MAG: outer membrane beta-barrel protein, partial [Myxococcota bacterium]
PGLVIGGAISGVSVTEPDYEAKRNGETTDGTLEDTTVTQSNIGLLIDYYFDPEGGFHMQGLLGLGVLAVEYDNEDIDDRSATGPSLALGLGYEGWVGEQWGIGGLFRLTAAALTEDEDDVKLNHSVLTPAILFTATHH